MWRRASRTGAAFSSTSRPWHDPNSVRPELLLTDDPPKHTRRARSGGERAVAQGAQPHGRGFPRRCTRHRRRPARTRGRGRSMPSATSRRPSSTRCCLICIGLAEEGREHMYAFGHMVWATMGPMNDLFHEAMRDTSGDVLAWAGAVLQARQSRAGQSRHGDVRSRGSRRGHAGGGRTAGGHPALGRGGHHGA